MIKAMHTNRLEENKSLIRRENIIQTPVNKSYFRNRCKAFLLTLIRVQKIELKHFYVRLQTMGHRNGTMGD